MNLFNFFAVRRYVQQIDFSVSVQLSWFLDLSRALAAFFVVIGHVRSVVFMEHIEYQSLFSFAWLFDSITGLGHHAVVVFFVLSGFLIGKKAIEVAVNPGSSYLPYFLDRMTRLYVVLIPALLFGGGLDFILLHVLNGSQLASFHYIDNRLGIFPFLGNILALQTVIAPVFGSNGPLWSLANETWYYLLFPLALAVATRKNKSLSLSLLVFIFLFLGYFNASILKYGVLWLFGVIAWFMPLVEIRKWFFFAVLSLLLLTASCDFLKIPGFGFVHVLLTGLIISLLISEYKNKGGLIFFDGFVKQLSAFSYSLYLFHFPLLVLISFILSGTKYVGRQSFDSVGVSVWLAIVLVLYLYSYLLYLLFERHYHILRRACYKFCRISDRKIQAEPKL